ncbi:transcription factor bHLH18 [Morus notabilis]|uniref:transcription factor bHLH18 n=1 Tax=Morus notabilis TaxID=981085 RepID=UPI000CECF69A|nr:transcription factor bHLH18 [Morus notabilis]
MDVASAKWLSELGLDQDYSSSFFHKSEMNSLNQFGFISEEVATALGEDYKQSFSSESYSSYSTITTKNPSNAASSGSDYSVKDSQVSFDRPPKQLKISGSPSSQLILSFENSNSSPTRPQRHVYGNFESTLRPKKEAASQIDHVPYFSSVVTKDHSVLNGDNIDSAPKTSIKGTKRSFSSMTRTPSHAQEHIMAERRRREKLSQRFIALSAILPGLKKMDKASVLGDAIKYVKELQERMKTLEEQNKKRTVESVVFVKKSQLMISSTDDDTSSSNDSHDSHSDEVLLPEIEARVSEKDVLIRIHCEKQKGFMVKMLSEIEKLHLSIVNTSVLPFGNSTFDITVIAQMENEFNMTVKDLVKNLRQALLKFM